MVVENFEVVEEAFVKKAMTPALQVDKIGSLDTTKSQIDLKLFRSSKARNISPTYLTYITFLTYGNPHTNTYIHTYIPTLHLLYTDRQTVR